MKDLNQKDIRILAEKMADDKKHIDVDFLTKIEIKNLVHELQVHQIELEMQNEELKTSEQNLVESKRELEKAKDLFTHLYHESPSGYATVDEYGIITQANQTFSRLIGMPLDSIEKKPFVNFISEKDQTIFRARFKSLFRNPQNKTMELNLLTYPDGNFPALVEFKSVYWTTLAGERECLLLNVLDITERKNMENRMIQAQEDAEKANNAKSEFMARMSHELRTPMNAILGFAQMLQLDETITQKQRFQIDEIFLSGNHLLHLINEILDLAGIESGRVPVVIERVNIHEVLNEALLLVQSIADRFSVKIILSNEDENIDVMADKVRIRQILLNLISNAAKYNRPGGEVKIRYQKEKIHSDSEQELFSLKLFVEDTGIGIREKDYARVFEAFQRVHKPNDNIEGAGVGLNITKKLLEMMDGTIDFKSEFGKGSTFWIELPVADM